MTMVVVRQLWHFFAQENILWSDTNLNLFTHRKTTAQGGLQHANFGIDHHHAVGCVQVFDGAFDKVDAAHKVGHKFTVGCFVNFAWCPTLNDPAIAHHSDFVRERQSLRLVVCDVNGGDAHLALDLFQLETHFFAQLGVQVGQRLVEQQEFGLHHQSACQSQTLLLAARQTGGITVTVLCQFYCLQGAHDSGFNFFRGVVFVAHLQREARIFKNSHVRPDGV